MKASEANKIATESTYELTSILLMIKDFSAKGKFTYQTKILRQDTKDGLKELGYSLGTVSHNNTQIDTISWQNK